MKKLLLLLLFPTTLCAQEEEPPKQYNHSIYGEFLGNGGGFSINYERIFHLNEKWQLIPRAGISYVPVFDGFAAIPFELTVVNKKLEFGIGATPSGAWGWETLKYIRIGYRSVDKSGLLFRIAFTPWFEKDGYGGILIRPSGGISVGKSF